MTEGLRLSYNMTVLGLLRKGRVLTEMKAFEKYGMCCLAQRIYDLRKAGWRIKTRMVIKSNRRYGEYYLPAEER